MQEHFYYLYFFFFHFTLTFYLLQIVSAESNIKPIINTWMATKDDNKTGFGCLCVPMAREMTHQHLHLTFYLSPSIYLFVTLYMGQFASFNVFISLSDVSNVLLFSHLL